MTESDFLARLRRLPLHPGAHGLNDDSATLGPYTITTDTLVEGVHYLPTDPADTVAWKLLATNLSDLAAKGATPVGVLLNYPLRRGAGDTEWDDAFLRGIAEALRDFATPILGGDTVSLQPHAPRVLTLTAIGQSPRVPLRTGALAGDVLWVTGTIGDAGAGLRIAQGQPGPAELLNAYRRPRPRLTEGAALAPHVHAMMDVSDGLLIDASRMAAASRLAVTIDLATVPLSPEYRAFDGDQIAAATAGDDYELLFAAPSDWTPPVAATRVGTFAQGEGLTLTDAGKPVILPKSLGFQHAT
ncbi:thiamine-phosphate kinase [Sphingomonas aliaeris]|uniref:Thiamine-monophosphate kinase n=1 Tax=Sphingomonas aliaeris TaxID=2759526 RepID=A0A974S4M6_9SPHN|nr:thiamine-phosphate kinase [Sphingomonas aliaeris]QQV77773.1 thiamine-phosphate kinase [Sphingomonas aliaeris]